MKFATTLAVLALINNISAVKLQKAYADDLFTDDYEQQSLMESLSAAEKATGKQMSSKPKLSKEDFKDVVTAKTTMKFNDNDEFVGDAPVQYNKLQLDADIQFEEVDARPIGEFMTQIDVNTVEDENVINANGMLRSADADKQVLAGAQLNDDDDQKETLDSLRSAERVSGQKLVKADFGMHNYVKSGNLAQDFMADDNRVYTNYLTDALTDKETEDAKVKREQEAAKAAQLAKKTHEVKAVKEAEMELNVHFNDDDLMQTSAGVRFIDDADNMVEHADSQ